MTKRLRRRGLSPFSFASSGCGSVVVRASLIALAGVKVTYSVSGEEASSASRFRRTTKARCAIGRSRFRQRCLNPPDRAQGPDGIVVGLDVRPFRVRRAVLVLSRGQGGAFAPRRAC